MRLHWPDCRNVRDLGGLPAAGGRTVRDRALVRADSLNRLTADGVAALHAHGVVRVVDLRGVDEAERWPSALAGHAMVHSLPLIDPADDPARDLPDLAPMGDVYRASIIGNGPRVAAVVAAVAAAPPGAVLVHCAAGQDRTGIVVAVLLRVAGVPDDEIAADYAFSAVCRERPGEAEPEAILAALARVDELFGDVEAYLRANGIAEDRFAAVRARLAG
ncbi:tyrosine-protein phosphatase [Dactylosporangium sp. McL0621]|uniref:tyrosine-protein phosphatase n=1 Tax=Dactylosporangium sp. McL0621 TaxID=3415678 RepID=UPI003CF9A266